ncbi:MAG TPA: DUF441 domain-containing protein [Massilibacterium sp.]|nr:DUF441 domain-containing protein [Massilibacterium sp.]
MFSQATLFLLLLLIIALISKNQSLLIAVCFLLIVKLLQLDGKWFPVIQQRGIHWGVTIITIAVLIPIATGEIGFKQLGGAMKTTTGWVALLAGIAVALLGARGIDLLAEDPHLTTALVFGTIFAVVFFKGVAVGPVIAAGIAYMFMKMIQYLFPL